MKVILSPCPLCGGEPQIIKPFQLNENGVSENVKAISCTKCLLRTHGYKDIVKVVELWNKRHKNKQGSIYAVEVSE